MNIAHVVPELRAAHTLRFNAWSPNDAVLYRKLKWDNFDFVPDANYSRFKFTSFAVAIFKRKYQVVELPEPLWVREIPFTFLLAVVIKLLSLGKVRVVAYCIENNSIEDLLAPPGILRSVLVTPFIWVLRQLVRLTFDRLAFGSPSAAESYNRIVDSNHTLVEQFLELPNPVPHEIPTENTGILFVGRLEHRKGVLALLQALDKTIHMHGTPVTIVGDGPLAPSVHEWVKEFPSLRTYIPKASHVDMAAIYRANRVLVAPSTRDGRWREQIGLPIKEALSFGLTVVTSFESGLSDFLHETGHFVTLDLRFLRESVDKAIACPIEPACVISSLPEIDGRHQAHNWLLKF